MSKKKNVKKVNTIQEVILDMVEGVLGAMWCIGVIAILNIAIDWVIADALRFAITIGAGSYLLNKYQSKKKTTRK